MSIFTAESQRAQRSHFLFGGERPPNKRLFHETGKTPLQCQRDRTHSECVPEGLSLVIQSLLRPACPAYAEAASRRQAERCTSACSHDWITEENNSPRSPRLSGEPGLERNE
jgi:hypothetical protein